MKSKPRFKWKWWQALLASTVGFGSFGLLPGLLPPYSATVTRLGLVLATITVVAAMWSWWRFSWWARISAALGWSLEVLGIAARAWSLVFGISLLWMVPVLSAFLLALSMPVLRPRISAILWREQTAPQTATGRAILGIALAIGPSAGIIGASIGMFSDRLGEMETAMLVLGALATAVAIGFAFAFSYQLWPDRPWAQSEEQAHQEST